VSNAAESHPEPSRLLRIRVSLNGRPVSSHVFDKETILVGRDPECDVVLDNVGVSRHHLKFELRPNGSYAVLDLDSANGTRFNDQPLTKDFIDGGGDLIQIGKFTLSVTREADRRFLTDQRRATPDAFAHTTVLSLEDLKKVEQEARQHRMAAVIAPSESPGAHSAAGHTRDAHARPPLALILPVVFLAGVAAGLVLARLIGN
jgi:pSer/pThr/pTyr-binding forkhead associated (FHA) protein